MVFGGNTRKYCVFEPDLVFSHEKSFLENCSFSKTTWNFKERFEDTRVKTSNMKFIMLLDHQAAHIYKYMGQNIANILGFLGYKNSFMLQTLKLLDWGRTGDY